MNFAYKYLKYKYKYDNITGGNSYTELYFTQISGDKHKKIVTEIKTDKFLKMIKNNKNMHHLFDIFYTCFDIMDNDKIINNDSIAMYKDSLITANNNLFLKIIECIEIKYLLLNNENYETYYKNIPKREILSLINDNKKFIDFINLLKEYQYIDKDVNYNMYVGDDEYSMIKESIIVNPINDELITIEYLDLFESQYIFLKDVIFIDIHIYLVDTINNNNTLINAQINKYDLHILSEYYYNAEDFIMLLKNLNYLQKDINYMFFNGQDNDKIMEKIKLKNFIKQFTSGDADKKIYLMTVDNSIISKDVSGFKYSVKNNKIIFNTQKYYDYLKDNVLSETDISPNTNNVDFVTGVGTMHIFKNNHNKLVYLFGEFHSAAKYFECMDVAINSKYSDNMYVTQYIKKLILNENKEKISMFVENSYHPITGYSKYYRSKDSNFNSSLQILSMEFYECFYNYYLQQQKCINKYPNLKLYLMDLRRDEQFHNSMSYKYIMSMISRIIYYYKLIKSNDKTNFLNEQINNIAQIKKNLADLHDKLLLITKNINLQNVNDIYREIYSKQLDLSKYYENMEIPSNNNNHEFKKEIISQIKILRNDILATVPTILKNINDSIKKEFIELLDIYEKIYESYNHQIDCFIKYNAIKLSSLNIKFIMIKIIKYIKKIYIFNDKNKYVSNIIVNNDTILNFFSNFDDKTKQTIFNFYDSNEYIKRIFKTSTAHYNMYINIETIDINNINIDNVNRYSGLIDHEFIQYINNITVANYGKYMDFYILNELLGHTNIDPNQNSIIVAGAAHTQNYYEIFNRLNYTLIYRSNTHSINSSCHKLNIPALKKIKFPN